MPIGKMDKRVTFQANTKTPDGSGGFTYTWGDYYTCWARIRPMKASRKLADNQVVLVQASEITIRYNDVKPITKDLQMIFNGATYTIISDVNIDEANKTLQIVVTRKQ